MLPRVPLGRRVVENLSVTLFHLLECVRGIEWGNRNISTVDLVMD
jgi:hypothetical protein